MHLRDRSAFATMPSAELTIKSSRVHAVQEAPTFPGMRYEPKIR